MRNCNFSVQNGQSCQDLCNCNNFFTHYGKFTQIIKDIVEFHISKVICIILQHSCQVVHHRAPKLSGAGDTFSR